MKTEKHILKGEIKEEDDKKYVIKDEIEEDEALERNGHSEVKALQRGDQKEVAPPAEKPWLPCERCFLQMKSDPGHACVMKPDRSLCDFCYEKSRVCVNVSDWHESAE
jgi:hypothetical protein